MCILCYELPNDTSTYTHISDKCINLKFINCSDYKIFIQYY